MGRADHAVFVLPSSLWVLRIGFTVCVGSFRDRYLNGHEVGASTGVIDRAGHGEPVVVPRDGNITILTISSVNSIRWKDPWDYN